MSYRLPRSRAFRIPEQNELLSPKWAPNYLRAKLANPPRRRVHKETAKDQRLSETVPSDNEDDTPLACAFRKYDPYEDKKKDRVGEPHNDSPAIASSRRTFHGAYSRKSKSQPLSIPSPPRSWRPRRSDGEILPPLSRSAFFDAASWLSVKKSATSTVVDSQARPKLLEESLYPYQRFHPAWRDNLYILFAWSRSSPAEREHPPKIRVPKRNGAWFRYVFQDENIDNMARRWHELRIWERRTQWPHLMIHCLRLSPEKALCLLKATYIKPLPPFEMVMDALFYLKRIEGEKIKSSIKLLEHYRQILSWHSHPSRWPFQMEKKHLALILEDFTLDEGKALFLKLQDGNFSVTYHCKLLFMDFFTRGRDTEMALKVLNGIQRTLRLKSDAALLQRCTNLLKLDSITTDGVSPNFRLLPQILEAGVRPNSFIHNSIMKNAVYLGASGVAWDLFRYIQKNDLPTSPHTYLILLQDALDRRDTAGLEEIWDLIAARSDLSENAHLMAFTLNVMRFVHGQDLTLSPSAVFSRMVAVYSRAFSTAPLIHLKMVSRDSTSPSNHNKALPEIETLSYVVQSYILIQQSPLVVESLLDWIEYLRSQGDSLATSLTECLPFNDGLMSFFARRTETLPNCLQVIQSMLDRGVQPSARTWGVVLLAFVRHGQPQAATKVKMMMEQQGIRLEKRTARLLTEFPSLDEAIACKNLAAHDLDEASEAVPLGQEITLLDIGQISQCEETILAHAVDDDISLDVYQQQDVARVQRSSVCDHDDGFEPEAIKTIPWKRTTIPIRRMPARIRHTTVPIRQTTAPINKPQFP